MMDMLEAQNLRGTFFLNPYEIAIHGDEFTAQAARQIHARGHDLELHTHPLPVFRRYGISNAPFEEQVAILAWGIDRIRRWTGKRIVAHRAGAFSANLDTLRAMDAVGLRVDCSLSPGSRVRVPLVKELGVSNLARRVGAIWEIPMTYFDQVRIGRWSSRRILDLEGNSLSEIKHVTRQAIRHRVPTVCILVHSFSFLRSGRPNRRVIRRFAALLEWLREQDDIKVATVEQECQRLDAWGLPQPQTVDLRGGIWLTWCRALQSWNDGWKNLAVSAAGVGCVATVALVLVYLGLALMKQ
jgi:hypothetical protein